MEIAGRAAADIGLPGMPGTEGIRLLKAALSWPARAHAHVNRALWNLPAIPRVRDYLADRPPAHLKIVHPHTCTQIGISGSFGGCALRWPV